MPVTFQKYYLDQQRAERDPAEKKTRRSTLSSSIQADSGLTFDLKNFSNKKTFLKDNPVVWCGLFIEIIN